MSDGEFLAEDYRYTADLLRRYTAEDRADLFRAVCSNNLSIILAALNIAEGVAPVAEEDAA